MADTSAFLYPRAVTSYRHPKVDAKSAPCRNACYLRRLQKHQIYGLLIAHLMMEEPVMRHCNSMVSVAKCLVGLANSVQHARDTMTLLRVVDR
ncbi:hypothetical protein F506_16995 [Herbaspirillum hiltneri N3]|uniref:Uncharacterized protein n=1 Tax=Herbaspirillum hiltneri N3 TaxID=1262470 RepID=A0ABM5V3F1_9BURK|nr:hypothetical protein F506_16995 [Herbaspirillum hiltneri N3]